MKRILLASVLAFSFACASDNDGPPTDMPPDGFLKYPEGPFGASEPYTDDNGDFHSGDVIRNIVFTAFVDTDDNDDFSFDDDPRLFELAEYYVENDPEARLIMITGGAGWCGPCQLEAAIVPEIYRELGQYGMRFVGTLFQDEFGERVGTEFAQEWAEDYELNVPLAVDSTFQMGAYFDAGSIPTNILIDAQTMEIIDISEGVQLNPSMPSDPTPMMRDLCGWLEEVDSDFDAGDAPECP